VDDRRLAVAVTETRREQGYGRLRTARDLAGLAVDEPAAAEALGTLPNDVWQGVNDVGTLSGIGKY
jgi:SOS response regulatory protein OraA/RecX